MSLANDAVAVFKSRFLTVVHKSDTKLPTAPFTAETTTPLAPTVLDQSLLAVARDSADIRRSHDTILSKAALLSTLKDDLLTVFDSAYQALEQLAEARSQLATAEVVAKFERDARENAAQRLRSLTSTYHQTVSELEKLRPETKRLEVALQQTNEKLARFEVETGALSEQLGEARAEIERKRAEEAQTRREQEAVKTELAAANKFIAQKIAEIGQLGERCEIAEQAARVSARALEESRSECGAALVRLDEERVNFANAQSRSMALETQLKDLGDRFGAARVAWSKDAERFNETVDELKDQLAQARGLDEAHQRLLATAQSELEALRRQSSGLERQLGESQLNAGQLLARAEGGEAARDQFGKELVASKRLHQSLLRRVKPMISALREKNAESIKLSATLAEIDQRFLAYQAETAEAIRELQDRETHLVAELETERARRVVAEGSLAIDRSFRPVEIHRKKTDADE